MFSWLTDILLLMACFVDNDANNDYFFLKVISILCSSLAFFFLLVLKVSFHGKFWDTLVKFLGGEGDDFLVLIHHCVYYVWKGHNLLSSEIICF